MAYITMAEYEQMGYSLALNSRFARLALLATKEIDYRTSNRITEVTDEIRLVACEVVDILYQNESGDKITSVSTDGYSESYAEPMGTDDQIWNVCLKYLPQNLTTWAVNR